MTVVGGKPRGLLEATKIVRPCPLGGARPVADPGNTGVAKAGVQGLLDEVWAGDTVDPAGPGAASSQGGLWAGLPSSSIGGSISPFARGPILGRMSKHAKGQVT